MRFIYCFTLLIACFWLQACISIIPFGMGRNRGKVAIEEIRPAERFFTTDQILMIPLSGLVRMGSGSALLGEPGMLVALKDRLLAAEDNSRLKAVVLRIDSPGGAITASDLIHRELATFKKRTGLPLIAHLSDTAASGAVYIAMAADEIYALPTTITGSIGVMVMLPQFHELGNKIGVGMEVIKAGENKDSGSPWRPLTGEQRVNFQQLIDGYYDRFCQVILAGRKDKGLTADKLKAIADGRVYGPETAREAGLIDGIKYPEEVYDRAMELAGLVDAEVVSYEYPFTYRGHIYARQPGPRPELLGENGSGDVNFIKLDLGQWLRPSAGARFLYLWMP